MDAEKTNVETKMERIPHLLNPGELANKLNVPKSRIYGFSRETGPDTIPMIKVGKYCRFELDKVLEWLKNKSE